MTRFRVALLSALLATSYASAQRTSRLLLDLFSPDGRAMSASDFAQQTNFTPSSKWIIGDNYGVYTMGQLPASNQIGTRPISVTEGSREFISLMIPSSQAVYFTALWKADGIGTVFMRADNSGKGYTVADDQSLVLQIPTNLLCPNTPSPPNSPPAPRRPFPQPPRTTCREPRCSSKPLLQHQTIPRERSHPTRR